MRVGPALNTERAAPQPHLHELRAGAHVLPEAEQEALLGGQDLRQLRVRERQHR